MWTISSARSSRAAGLLLLGLASAAPLSCAPASASPEPVAARSAALHGKGRPPHRPPPQHHRPVVLRSVRARRPGPDLSRVAGPGFQDLARDPLVIEVRVAEPIDPRPRDSAPVIVLNGQVLRNTYARVEAPDQLLAFLPDRKLVKEGNEVFVVWTGNAARTRSPQALTFADGDISP